MHLNGKKYDFDDKTKRELINIDLKNALKHIGSDRLKIIGTLRGKNLIAHYNEFDGAYHLLIGDTLQNAVAITKPINYTELMSGQRIDFVQRYVNFIKTKPLMRLVADENALKESIENAQRALQNAQSKDMSSLLNELNDKRARLDEIDIFLGRVEDSSPAVERAKARYGDEYKQIIVDKINKESEQSGGSDIVFAPKREKNGIMPSEDLAKLDKMSGKKQGEKVNLNEFLNDKGEVDYAKLEKIAIDLPSSLNYKKFLAQFDDSDKVIIKTPIKDLQINPRYMFFHLTKDGDKKGKFKGNGKENRIYLSDGVLDTLKKPLFVTQDSDETYYFYKAFKNNKGLINLISIAVPKNNSQMIYRTSYNGSDNRIAEIIKEHKLIYKAD